MLGRITCSTDVSAIGSKKVLRRILCKKVAVLSGILHTTRHRPLMVIPAKTLPTPSTGDYHYMWTGNLENGGRTLRHAHEDLGISKEWTE